MKMILVDDEIGTLELLREEVRAVVPDAQVHVFQFPEEALHYAEHDTPDVAFLDIEMPQMNGIELAKRLKARYDRMNIIFVTAYDDFGLDAMKLHASGYLLKPVERMAVKRELEALRYPQKEERGIYIHTFGQFDVFVDGKMVMFHRLKSKEMLAYLVDQRGGSVTKREIASVLFEDREYDRSLQDYMNKIVRDLELTLKEINASQILNRQRNSYSVNTDKFRCDLYEYEAGLPVALNAFRGSYMRQYTWSEETLGNLLYHNVHHLSIT